MGIDGTRLISIKGILQTIHSILHATHNVAHVLAADAEIVGSSTCQPEALLAAIVLVQCAVSGWLIGVEIAFNQESWYAMLQGTQVAIVSNPRGAVSAVCPAAIKADVARDVGVRFVDDTRAAIGRVNLVHPVARPAGLAHRRAAGHRFAGIGTAVDVQRVIGRIAVGQRIGVDRHKHVIVTLLGFGSNDRQLFVVQELIAGIFHIREWAVGRP